MIDFPRLKSEITRIAKREIIHTILSLREALRSLSPMRFHVLVLPVTLVLSGCVVMIWPHREQVVPAVSGRIVRAGEPVSGADVYVLPSLKDGCSRSKYHAITDTSGRFAISGDRETSLVEVFGDRNVPWGICIDVSGSLIEGSRARGFGFPPPAIAAVCDLSKTSDICNLRWPD